MANIAILYAISYNFSVGTNQLINLHLISGHSMEKKNSVFANLSQAVRKARESHHNGKNREEDEVNSKR